MEKKDPIGEYIRAWPPEVQDILVRTREAISSCLPPCQEVISWSMPTFKDKKNIIHFAANKGHLGIYPGPRTIEHFSHRLGDYKFSKGAVQFPYKKEIPYGLIQEMALYSYENQK